MSLQGEGKLEKKPRNNPSDHCGITIPIAFNHNNISRSQNSFIRSGPGPAVDC